MSVATPDVDSSIEAVQAEIRERQEKLAALQEQKKQRKKNTGIPANVIAVRAFCDDEAVRYSLNTIRIDVKDGRYDVAATNSKTLAVVSGSAGDIPDVSALVLHHELAAVVSSNGGNPKTLEGCGTLLFNVHAPENDRLKITGSRNGQDGTAVVCQPPAGRFPRYQDVIPRGEITKRIMFAPKELAAALKLCAKFTDDNDTVEIEFRGDFDPVVLKPKLTTESDQKLLVVVMPKGDEA